MVPSTLDMVPSTLDIVPSTQTRFSPDGPDMVGFIPNQSPNYRNHTGIDAKRGETPPRYFYAITFGINKITGPKTRET